MKLLKALETGKVSVGVVLKFDKPFETSDFSFGILSLERYERSLYLDVTESFTYDKEIHLVLKYDEDVLSSDVSKKADLELKDLVLGLNEAKLYIGEDDYTEPLDMYLIVENGDFRLEINLEID
jgi:hypothetical protein